MQKNAIENTNESFLLSNQDENDDIDALGSFLYWDEVDETSGNNRASNDLNSSNELGANVNNAQNQNLYNPVYDNGFLAQLKAEIAAHNTTNSPQSSSETLLTQIPNSQQDLSNSNAEMQQRVQAQQQQAQNFSNYVPQQVTTGNFSQQMFAPNLNKPIQQGAPVFTPAHHGLVNTPPQNAQQQNEVMPNVYIQMQQLNPNFIRALQQNLAAQMPAPTVQQHLSAQSPSHTTQQSVQSQSQQHSGLVPGRVEVTAQNACTNVLTRPTTVPQSKCRDPNINEKKSQASSELKKIEQQIQINEKNGIPSNTIVQGYPQQIVSCSDTDNDGLSVSASSNFSLKRSHATIEGLSTDYSVAEIELNPQDKAKANRDRNREHARNTRLRKKAYLEKLKTTVDELCKERDELVSERSGKVHLLVEVNNSRTKVLLNFFSLRSSNVTRREVWSSILDESTFRCVLPVTPYRSFPASEVQINRSQRTILGIDGMIADNVSLHVLLNSLVDRSLYPEGKIIFAYKLSPDDTIVSENQMMTRWTMTTLNAVKNGARAEISTSGFLCCKFSSSHTIVSVELMFDVMAFMLQLKQSSGAETFTVIPNTLQTSQRPYAEPMIVTAAEAPYTIVQVNRLWEEMSGYNAKEVIGKCTPRLLQGKETNPRIIQEIMLAISYRRPGQVTILNYRKNGKKFINYLSLYPLSTDSKITHYLGLSHHVTMLEEVKKISTENTPADKQQKQRESSVSATSATVSSMTSKSSNSMSSNGSNNQQKSVQRDIVHV